MENKETKERSIAIVAASALLVAGSLLSGCALTTRKSVDLTDRYHPVEESVIALRFGDVEPEKKLPSVLNGHD